jgi:hypothetical protein
MNFVLTAMAVSIWLLMNHHSLFAHAPRWSREPEYLLRCASRPES